MPARTPTTSTTSDWAAWRSKARTASPTSGAARCAWRAAATTRAARGAFPSTFDTDQDQATWQNDISLGSTTNLSAGAEWRRERVTSTTAYTQTSRITSSLFAAAQHALGAVALEESLRTDHNSQFGTHTTGRIGAGWSFAPDWRITGGSGHGVSRADLQRPVLPLAVRLLGQPQPRARAVARRRCRVALPQRRHHGEPGRVRQPHRRPDRGGPDLQHGDQRQPRAHPRHHADGGAAVGRVAGRPRVDAPEPARRRHRQPAGAPRAGPRARRAGLRCRRVATRRRSGGQQRTLRQRGQHAGFAHGRLRPAVAVCQLVDHARVHARRARAQRHRQALRDRAGLQHRAAPIHVRRRSTTARGRCS